MPLTAGHINPRKIFLAGLLSFIILTPLAIGAVYFNTLILAVSALFLVCILIFKKPLLGLALIIPMVFLSNITININSPYRRADEIVLFAIIPIFLLYVILFPRILNGIRHSDNHVKDIVLLLSLFFGWAAISIFWTHDLYHGINMLATLMVSMMMIPAFLALVNDKEQLYKALRVFPLLGVALGIFLIFSKWYHGVKEVNVFPGLALSLVMIIDEKRPGGFAPPNMAAAIMNIFLFITIALMYRAGILKKIMLGLIALFFVVCGFLTASKAGVGSLLAGLLLLVFIVPYLQKWKIRITIAFLLFMSLVLAVVGEFLIKRFQLLIEKGMSFTGDRLGWWETGFNKLLDTYGIGLGIGGFLKYIDPVPGVHSFYFSLLFDLGVVGVLLFIIIMAVLINNLGKIFKACEDKEMVFIACSFVANIAAFGIQAVFNEDFHSMHFWLLMALMFTVLKIAGKTKESMPETPMVKARESVAL